MTDPTCSIEACARPALKRGWCRAHYLRWYRYGDPLAGRGVVKPTVLAVCSVEGCDNTLACKGYCSAHYQRSVAGRDVAGEPIQAKRPGALCSLTGCDSPHYGRGYCKFHYQRWWNQGDPLAVLPGAWKGDDAGYSAVHQRLVTTRGSASSHRCAHCEGAAQDWAYDGTCPNERRGERHGALLAYSTDPDRYMPLCRPCHKAFDLGVATT